MRSLTDLLPMLPTNVATAWERESRAAYSLLDKEDYDKAIEHARTSGLPIDAALKLRNDKKKAGLYEEPLAGEFMQTVVRSKVADLEGIADSPEIAYMLRLMQRELMAAMLTTAFHGKYEIDTNFLNEMAWMAIDPNAVEIEDAVQPIQAGQFDVELG